MISEPKRIQPHLLKAEFIEASLERGIAVHLEARAIAMSPRSGKDSEFIFVVADIQLIEFHHIAVKKLLSLEYESGAEVFIAQILKAKFRSIFLVPAQFLAALLVIIIEPICALPPYVEGFLRLSKKRAEKQQQKAK